MFIDIEPQPQLALKLSLNLADLSLVVLKKLFLQNQGGVLEVNVNNQSDGLSSRIIK